MTDQDFTQLKYWIDLAVKAIIGIVISIVGLDYRSVKTKLDDLEEHKHKMITEVGIIRTELSYIKDGISNIDKKIDRAFHK